MIVFSLAKSARVLALFPPNGLHASAEKCSISLKFVSVCEWVLRISYGKSDSFHFCQIDFERFDVPVNALAFWSAIKDKGVLLPFDFSRHEETKSVSPLTPKESGQYPAVILLEWKSGDSPQQLNVGPPANFSMQTYQ